ncbi:LppX_LprAFG lipoprotein [Streptomyces sp. NPDC058335]|uniref:LppX_LprAFG lipoprotein n=1 Tax=Streptomyces sp. NPDC058335 TaxID=3346451 RepID=UPI0036643291
MRRLATMAAGIAAAALLSGCSAGETGKAPAPTAKNEASATPRSESVFEVEAALKNADPAPYSAEITTKTYTGPVPGVVMSGRMNFNGPALTGKLTLKTSDSVPEDQAFNAETILLEDATYTRTLDDDGAAGQWQRMGRDSSAAGLADYGAYAQLLLDLGPEARKGTEEVGGAPAYRLSGNVTQDQLRTVDRRLYDRMRATGTKTFACDVWVNESGRVVRFEQWLEMSGKSARNVVTFKNFGAPVPVSAPE